MKKYVAEFLGTCVLVLIGCGAAVISGVFAAPTGLGVLGIALAFGLALTVMIYTIGPISGCHINPAVTVSMLVARKISAQDALAYIIAQFTGATLGAYIIYTIQSGMPGFQMTEWALASNGWGEGYLGAYNITSAFIAETVLSFVFLFVIFSTTSRWGNSTMAGMAIGLSLVLIHMFAIPITGTSVNPARSFGPAILAQGKALQQLWLFIIAPISGGIAAALVWTYFFEKEMSKD